SAKSFWGSSGVHSGVKEAHRDNCWGGWVVWSVWEMRKSSKDSGVARSVSLSLFNVVDIPEALGNIYLPSGSSLVIVFFIISS
ncbi:16050_t:CDS:2, partial [Dentiscutata heterogama]